MTDDGGGPVTAAYVHDAAGNLVFDGRLLYLYDGCNRLTDDERRLFDAARERYWKRQWDEGRFRDLPE